MLGIDHDQCIWYRSWFLNARVCTSAIECAIDNRRFMCSIVSVLRFFFVACCFLSTFVLSPKITLRWSYFVYLRAFHVLIRVANEERRKERHDSENMTHNTIAIYTIDQADIKEPTNKTVENLKYNPPKKTYIVHLCVCDGQFSFIIFSDWTADNSANAKPSEIWFLYW